MQRPICITVLLLCVGSRAGAQERNLRPPDWFFDRPEFLCLALEENGIHANAWAIPIGKLQSANDPFFCQNNVAVPAAANSPESPGIDTVFRVSGRVKTRADLVTIAITVVEPDTVLAGQMEITRDLATFFKVIGQSVPAGLLASIEGRHPYLSRQPYGTVWFDFVTPTRTPTGRVFWFRLYQPG